MLSNCSQYQSTMYCTAVFMNKGRIWSTWAPVRLLQPSAQLPDTKKRQSRPFFTKTTQLPQAQNSRVNWKDVTDIAVNTMSISVYMKTVTPPLIAHIMTHCQAQQTPQNRRIEPSIREKCLKLSTDPPRPNTQVVLGGQIPPGGGLVRSLMPSKNMS